MTEVLLYILWHSSEVRIRIGPTLINVQIHLRIEHWARKRLTLEMEVRVVDIGSKNITQMTIVQIFR